MGLPKARSETRNCVQIDYLGGDPRKHKAEGGKSETGRWEKPIQGWLMSWLPLWGTGAPSSWRHTEKLVHVSHIAPLRIRKTLCLTGGGSHLGPWTPCTSGMHKALCPRKSLGPVKEMEAVPSVGSRQDLGAVPCRGSGLRGNGPWPQQCLL